jgi:hypothetical protein
MNNLFLKNKSPQMNADTNIANQPVVIKDTTANPAPLGLLGFGMTTILLNIHNAGIYELDSMIMGMGIFMGGIAQIFAGITGMEKEQHLWRDRVHCVRFVLAFSCRIVADTCHIIRRGI